MERLFVLLFCNLKLKETCGVASGKERVEVLHLN